MAEANYSNSNGIVNGDKVNVTTEVKENGHLPSEPTRPRTSSSLRRGCSAKGSPPMRIAMSVRAKTASTSSDGSSHSEIKLSERRASRDREKMGGMLDGRVGSGGVREEEGTVETAQRPQSREAQENKGVCVCVCKLCQHACVQCEKTWHHQNITLWYNYHLLREQRRESQLYPPLILLSALAKLSHIVCVHKQSCNDSFLSCYTLFQAPLPHTSVVTVIVPLAVHRVMQGKAPILQAGEWSCDVM